MASLSERIRRFRQRIERDASAPPDEPEPDDDGSSGRTRRPSAVVRRVREGVERGQATAAEVKRRGETDLQRAQDRIERRVVPLEDEVKQTGRETRLLGQAVSRPVSTRAQKAVEELRELREEATDLRDRVADPLEAHRDGLKDEADTLKEQFGGLNTDLDDLGTGVEGALLYEAVDDPDRDGDLFETISDPLDDIEAELDMSDIEGPAGIDTSMDTVAGVEADLSGDVEEDFEDL